MVDDQKNYNFYVYDQVIKLKNFFKYTNKMKPKNVNKFNIHT